MPGTIAVGMCFVPSMPWKPVDGWAEMHSHVRQILAQPARVAHERAAGAEQRDEVRDAAFGLLDDLGAGGLVVRLPVGVVIVLIGVEVAVGIGVVDLADLADRAIGTFVGRGETSSAP